MSDSDFFCSKGQINAIATDLSHGQREPAMLGLNKCTAALVEASPYAQTLHHNFAAIMHGDAGATATANEQFAKLANDERTLWQSITDTAKSKSPASLCHLTIVENKDQGPHVEINGAKCH